ncbi:unnamed protein product [Mytilus edulis]|uniref:G-protein coupled receptors family 1 profile domain-containing protein n=1 Tax=Mytilus edulis TaxID=6550 RepID=A0A8S3UE47_MYTED|nr:unnamed protein product [Mytilus edulis]
MGFTFILSLCALILIPQEENIQVCRPQTVYGDRFYIVVLVICLPVTVIIFLLFIMSIITSCRLWKIYFKGTIAPMQVIREGPNITGQVRSPHITIGQSCQTLQNNISLVPRQRNSKEEITSIHDIFIQQINLKPANMGDNINKEKGESSKMICSQNRRAFDDPNCSNCKRAEKKIESVRSESLRVEESNYIAFQMTKEIPTNPSKSISTKNDCIGEENMETDTVGLNHNVSIVSTESVNSFDVNNTHLKKTWEMRAFLTTIIIAIQTVILTGPFVASYWIEILSSLSLTLQTKIILLIPLLLNSFSNPFLYAWRIPEIRQEFGKLFRVNT